jgi:hypothetical protein
MKIFILLALLVPTTLLAQGRDFCARNRNDILALMAQPSARMAFKNNGGIGNGGVCWWHSRYQRSSFFLVKYAPEKAKPNWLQLQQIINGIRNMNSVVTIPGFADFQSFTRAYQNQIQGVLNDWQVFDGVFNFEWIRGISGNSALPPKDMEARMDAVYQSYRQSPAAMWVLAQMQGISSHAFLVIHMEKVNGGYDMDLIDSNHPLEIVSVRYQSGDQFLVTNRGSNQFVPYVGFQDDFRKIKASLVGHCRNKDLEFMEDFMTIKDGDVELPRRSSVGPR